MSHEQAAKDEEDARVAAQLQAKEEKDKVRRRQDQLLGCVELTVASMLWRVCLLSFSVYSLPPPKQVCSLRFLHQCCPFASPAPLRFLLLLWFLHSQAAAEAADVKRKADEKEAEEKVPICRCDRGVGSADAQTAHEKLVGARVLSLHLLFNAHASRDCPSVRRRPRPRRWQRSRLRRHR